MSGPLSTNEIEDVVSSVRRLVSTEQRPRVLSRDLGQDKLVLTPALRIVSDTSEPMAPTGPLILTTMVAIETDTPDSGAPEAVATVIEAEWEDELWTPDEPLLAEMALGAEEAEVVSTGSANIPATDETQVTQAAEVLAKAEVLTAWPEAAADWADEAETLDAPPVRPAEPAAEHPEEDLDVAEMLTAAVVEDEAFHVMDQDELQALVRSIVREELQGTLGERITRNVRKLVRAEINRALASRALD